MPEGMDPSLLQDFLTESTELIEQLDADLVTLETLSDPTQRRELLDKIFRALHTIKGAGSFLGLTTITHFAHAAEDALNRLRKGEVDVTPPVMDALLQSVDVVRTMISQLSSGQEVAPGPQNLIDRLHQIAEGRVTTFTPAPAVENKKTAASSASPTPTNHAVPTPANPAASTASAPSSNPAPSSTAAEELPLHLPPQKVDLLPFMSEDLHTQLQKLDEALHYADDSQQLPQAGQAIVAVSEELQKTIEFFELSDLTKLTGLLIHAGKTLPQLPLETINDLIPRLQAISLLIESQAKALERSVQLSWPLETFISRIQSLLQSQPLPPQAVVTNPDPQTILTIDGVFNTTSLSSTTTASATDTPPIIEPSSTASDTTPTVSDNDPTSPNPIATITPNAPASSATPTTPAAAGKETKSADPHAAAHVEQTIRVEVGRLEALLNLVGQLVLTKNRVLAMGRKCRDYDLPIEFIENVAGAAGDLDRLTSELQVGVMRTRMQPLAKLFERYPRVIRDIARSLDKKINLEITGKETEVDKSVLELLADPLVHILRNSADHGIESPATRQSAGKNPTGTIHLCAEHQGSHVRVEIRDDGKGLDRDALIKKAIDRGMITPDQASTLSNDEVHRFIFAAGFSTAEKVTDLSGRGVGMDVVRTNIAKLNGTVNVYSTKGQGTTIEILIPLTVAIMPAMVVGIDTALYCVPLQSIIEIVKPEKSMVHSVHGHPVMRLRESVLPLIDLPKRLGHQSASTDQFAVVVGVGGQRAGLLVDRLIGQQEIVIKPLDDTYTAGGPFSGATIREDGDVSLILDVIQLLRQAHSSPQERQAA